MLCAGRKLAGATAVTVQNALELEEGYREVKS